MKASDCSTFLRNVVAAAGASASVLIAGAALAGSVTYTYDTLGRVIRAAYSSGVVIVYTYDAAAIAPASSLRAPRKRARRLVPASIRFPQV